MRNLIIKTIYNTLFVYLLWFLCGVTIYALLTRGELSGEDSNLLLCVIHFQSLVGTLVMYSVMKVLAEDFRKWCGQLFT
jgi:hypothetical protein